MEKELDTFGKAPHYQQYLLEKAGSFSYSPFISILRDCGKPISLSVHFCDHMFDINILSENNSCHFYHFSEQQSPRWLYYQYGIA